MLKAVSLISLHNKEILVLIGAGKSLSIHKATTKVHSVYNTKLYKYQLLTNMKIIASPP